MASTLSTSEATRLAPATRGLKERGKKRPGPYPYWFYVAPRAHLRRSSSSFPPSPPSTSPSPAGTCSPRPGSAWTTTRPSSQEQALITGLRNTLIYAVITSGLKVVLGMALALLLTSKIIARGYLRSVIFFPVLVSTIGVGLTFTVLMNPEKGLINQALAVVGIDGPGWLTNPNLAHVLHRPGRRVEGRRTGHGHLHRRPGLDSRLSTTRPPRSTAPAAGTSSATSCCRWPGRPPPR